MSILDQTYENWTWVIVDGGKTTEVQELLEKHRGALRNRVTYVPSAATRPG
ncbi:glycosyltransferase family A protein [Verrucomicrobium spinosum]|uniref:glycosyltransferase family A protein n=1 Tax=Verrucomicrobium spinosum TaxID=2736 RepID=UPI003CCDE58B